WRGLGWRRRGLGGGVLRRLGAIVVNLPGAEIVPAPTSGAIDASEWVGPWLDMAMGLHRAANYYYYPGFHEPGTATTFAINKGVWGSVDARHRRLIEDARIWVINPKKAKALGIEVACVAARHRRRGDRMM